MLQYTNEERIAAGLEPFIHDPAISKIAGLNSPSMSNHGYRHDLFGMGPTDRALAAGYNCRAYRADGSYTYGLSENIHNLIRRPMSLDHLNDGLYTKDGVPVCLGLVPMEYAGTDPATGHRLYICREEGCHLKDAKTGIVHCDSETWEDPDSNLRLFGRIRRGSEEWREHYKKRKSIERTFKSMKQSRRLEAHCVRGLRAIRLHSLMSALVYQATSLAHLRNGNLYGMRWQTGKVD